MTQELDNLPARRGFALPAALEAEEQLNAIAAFQKTCHQFMIKGQDYGSAFPGSDKPTLLKPGAEKLVRLLGLSDHYVIDAIKDYEKPLFAFQINCSLIHIESGKVVASGLGECNSMEAKYRWRQGARVCPQCRKEAIIKSRPEYGGGWLCWEKKGGCNFTWAAGDPVIEDQEVGRVENEDIYSSVNTILKIAKKRSLVDAALSVGRLSGIFDQDLEDLDLDETDPNIVDAEPPRQDQGRSQGNRQPAQPRQTQGNPAPSAAGAEGQEPRPRRGRPPANKGPEQASTEAGQESQYWTPGALELKKRVEAAGKIDWDNFCQNVLHFNTWEDYIYVGGTARKAGIAYMTAYPASQGSPQDQTETTPNQAPEGLGTGELSDCTQHGYDGLKGTCPDCQAEAEASANAQDGE